MNVIFIKIKNKIKVIVSQFKLIINILYLPYVYSLIWVFVKFE